jgi:hypothetical protein
MDETDFEMGHAQKERVMHTIGVIVAELPSSRRDQGKR